MIDIKKLKETGPVRVRRIAGHFVAVVATLSLTLVAPVLLPADAASAAPPAQFTYVVPARNGELIASNYFSATGEIWHWAVRSNGYPGWESLGGSGGLVNTSPAAITNRDGRLEVFVVADGWLKHKYELSPGGAWSGWSRLGSTRLGAFTSKLAVALNKDGRAEVFIAQCDVIHLWRNNDGTWSDFAAFAAPGWGCIKSVLAAANSDGRLEIVGVTTTDAFAHMWQQTPGASWSSWEILFPAAPGVPIKAGQVQLGINRDGSLEVLFTIAGVMPSPYELFYARQTPAGWRAGSTGGMVWTNSPVGHDFNAVARQADGRLTHVVSDMDGVYFQTQTAPNVDNWTAQTRIGSWEVPGLAPATIAVTTHADGRLEIFAHVNSGTIWHACQLRPNGGWTDFTPVTDANCATPDRGAPDINRDSRPDLVGVQTDSGRLQSFYSIGNGGYVFGPDFGPGWGDYHNLTHAGDLNGDGKSDLVALRQSDGHLQSFYGLGTGGYVFGPGFGPGLANHYSLSDAGDLNGDGRRDLVAIRQSDGRLQSFYSNGPGGYTRGGDFGPGWGDFSELTNPGDLNGDGRSDLIAVRASTGRLQSFYSLGTGGYAFGPDFGPGWWAYRSFKNAGDLNGDGRADIVAIRNSDGRLQSFYSLGTGGYAFGPDFGPGWGDYDDLV